MTNQNVTAIKISTDNNCGITTKWYELDGKDMGTGYIFDKIVYGIAWTIDQYTIIDDENCPLTEGDHEWIAVKNSLNKKL